MSETSSGESRIGVAFDVPIEHALHVADYLRSISLIENFRLQSSTEAVEEEIAPAYNPEMVSWFDFPEQSKEPVAVVTHQDVSSFAAGRSRPSRQTVPLENVLYKYRRRQGRRNDPRYRQHPRREDPELDKLTPFLAKDEQGRAIGLIPDRLPDFVRRLRNGTLHTIGLGPVSIDILQEYADKLFASPAETD